jgi:hypothetical protein
MKPSILTPKNLLFLVLLCCVQMLHAQENILVEPNNEAQWQGLATPSGYATVATTNSYTLEKSVQISTFNNALNFTFPGDVVNMPGWDLDVRDISKAPATAGMPDGYYICGVAINKNLASGIPQMFLMRTMGTAPGGTNVAWVQVRPILNGELQAEAVSVVTTPSGDAVVVGNILGKIFPNPLSWNVYAALFPAAGGPPLWGNIYNCSCSGVISTTVFQGCEFKAREAVLDITNGGSMASNMGGVAITGRYVLPSNTTTAGSNDAFVMNLDGATGAENYRNVYPFLGGPGSGFVTEGYDIVQNPTNGFLGVTGSAIDPSGINNTYFFEIQSNGAFICNASLRVGSGSSTGRAIENSNSIGNYVIAGISNATNNSYLTEISGVMGSGPCGSPAWATGASIFPTSSPLNNVSESIIRNGNGYAVTSNAQVANSDIWIALTNNMGQSSSTACPFLNTNVNAMNGQGMMPMLMCAKNQPPWIMQQAMVLQVQPHEKYCSSNPPCQLSVIINGPAPCTTSSATLNAVVSGGSGSYSYSWSPGGATSPSISVSVDGSYCVVVTDSVTGCTATACFNFCKSFNASISGATSGCGAINLKALPNGMSYLWSTGATSQTISATASGTYCVTVTNSCGCTSTACKTVTINPKPVATVSPTAVTICNGECTTLKALPGSGVTYLWSTGATTQSISVCPSISTNYKVTVTNCFGCKTVVTRKVGVVNCTTTPGLGCFTSNDHPAERVEVSETIVIDAAAPSKSQSNDEVEIPETNLDNLATSDIEGSGEFSIFPNPSRGNFTVDYSAYLEQSVGLKLYDINGKTLRDIPLASSGKADVDISNLPGGVYYIVLRTEDGTLAKKIVLVRDK